MTPDHNSRNMEGPHLAVKGSGGRIFSIFFVEPTNPRDHVSPSDLEAMPKMLLPGWYWEDAEEKPNGPFRSSALAYVDATKGNYP